MSATSSATRFQDAARLEQPVVAGVDVRRAFLILGAAAFVGLVHFGTHSLAGDPRVFGRAGVAEAGTASAVAAGLVAAALTGE